VDALDVLEVHAVTVATAASLTAMDSAVPNRRPGLVVGAAVVRSGRVLAARRTRPSSAAGRWELPGGKVEAGESPEAALVREIAEELGCAIEVEAWLDGESAISATLVLRVARAGLVDGEPVPDEHDRLRWLAADELEEVDWLDSDRPFLLELATLLAR